MKSVIKAGSMITIFLLSGCGSGKTLPLEPSVSVMVPKSVSMQSGFPDALRPLMKELELQAALKGTDSAGKAVGQLGPVVAKKSGDNFEFLFPEVPSDLGETAELRIEGFLRRAGLEASCQQVLYVSKTVSIGAAPATFIITAAEEWRRDFDCDSDGLDNLQEFSEGLQVDKSDSDGDGVDDASDVFPLDASESRDTDGDGLGDDGKDNCPVVSNADQSDLDGDVAGDLCDTDIDGDGLSNETEAALSLNPRGTDTDGDSVPDNLDAFPSDPTQQSDTDGDLVADPLDNCVNVSNADQADIDADRTGDVCDSDIDGDGLLNEREIDTDPRIADFDNDGIRDGRDNCPATANALQADADGDTFGDKCDCDPLTATTYPGAPDDPDTTDLDSNCDGIDGDRKRAILVSNPSGLQTAVDEATAVGKDIYLATGSYNLSGLVWLEGLRIFGGYSPDFSERCVLGCEARFETILQSLTIQNVEGLFFFEGFSFQNGVSVENVAASFARNTIVGPDAGTRTVGVGVSGDSHVALESNRVEGGAGSRSSIGVYIEESDDVELVDNVILGGSGRFSVGVDVVGASPSIRRNTIDATSRFSSPDLATSQAIAFENALNITVENNILITGSAQNRYGMMVTGFGPVRIDTIRANLLASFPREGSVFLVNSLREYDVDITDGLDFVAGDSLTNYGFDSDQIGNLIDGEYHTVDDRYRGRQGATR